MAAISLITVAARDQTRTSDCVGEVVFSGMIGQFERYSADVFLPAMHGTNDLQEFGIYASLQQVSPRAGFQGPEDLEMSPYR